MLEYTAQDAYTVLKKSTNINAAIKNFIKREIRKGDPGEKFAKNLRNVLISKNEQTALDFIDGALPQFTNHLVTIACYAFPEFINNLVEEIVEKYADDFNATFEVTEDRLGYKDKAKFESIAKEAIGIIREKIKAEGMGDSPFMRNVIYLSIFEPAVIVAVENF